ncbi:hypothetical protein MNBD_NITROSPINAE01-1516 [hydrothermal vent metagenome]|uniref:DUF1508 domain-containing protein n=1 Tax=hydrothermal vent metagenome TaxID=652676 RepID=A0A3B1CNE9_9ZZZZ
MVYCIYKVNSTGEYSYDVDTKFPNSTRQGYTILECGLKTRKEADARLSEVKKEQAGK